MASCTVNSVELHYDDIGSGDAAIVWGHGSLCSARQYHALIEYFPEYRSVAVDFRGFGRSAAATTDGCTLDEMAQDVYALTQHLEIDRFVYVGHSMGSGIGLRVAAAYPGAVRAGIGLAGLAAAGQPRDPAVLDLLEGVQALQGDAALIATNMRGMFVHDGIDELLEVFAEDAARVGPGQFRAMSIGPEIFRDEHERLVATLHQPWMFLIPGRDSVVPPDRQLSTARDVPGARAVWLVDEGHMVPQERPDLVAREIRFFLDTLEK